VKIKSSETTPSKIAVCDNSENESLSVTTLATTEVTKDQHSVDKTHQTVVASKISPSVVDTQTNSLAGSATTESISQSVDPVTAKIVPSTLTTVYPSPPGSESNPSSYESVSAKRLGRKTQNRLEPPRRRGKKSAPVLPVASDALIGQDPKLSHHAQISPVNSLVGIDTSNVTQAKALEVLLPSGVANDSKRKQRATNPAQNKQQKVASPRIDSAPVSSDKVAPFGRIQNVSDVARVMKEVFSGTCLPKPKAHDPTGSEDRNTPFVQVTTKAAADASGSQNVEDKACSDIETAEVVFQTGNVAVNVNEKQSEGASDMQNPEGKPSLDTPTTGAPSLAPAMPLKRNKQESDIASDKNMILENMALPNVSKPETIGSGEVKEKAEQTQHYIENSTTKREMEGASDMQNPEGKPSLDTPTTGAPSLAPAMPVKGNKQEFDIASDKNMILENMALPNVSKPETIVSGEVKEKAEQTQHYIENSTTKSEMEAFDITPLNDEQKIDGSSERLRTSGGSTDISIETAPHEIGSSAASPVAEPPLVGDHNLGSRSDSLEKCSRSSPVAIDGTGCSTNPLGPEIFSNNHESSQADICVQSHSSANKAPDIIEDTSNEKLEPSEPSSSFACADNDNTGLLGQAEILSDQPKVTPPSPATDPQSRTIVVSSISESAEINCRSETESSLKASAELSLGEGIVGDKISASADHDRNNTEPPSLSLDPASPSEPSSKALEPSMKQDSESASEKEGSVSPKAVQAQQHPDALEPSDLRETLLVESISESLFQESRVIGDSISEAVVTDTVGVSGLGGETMSETAVLPPSTLVKEQNNGSVPLEKSMDKAVANCSGVQEEAKVDKVETDDPIDSSTRGIYTSPSSDELKDSKIEQGDSCIVEVGDELKDSKIEQGDNCIVEVGDELKDSKIEQGDNCIVEVGTSSSGNDCSESHSMSLRVSLCSDDSFGKPGVPQVDELITVPDTVQPSLSQLKEEENVGVSESKAVELSESQNDMEGSNADQRNCSDRLQSCHLVTVSHSSEDALLMKGTKLEVEIGDKINATHVSEPEGDPERLTSKNIDDLPSCSLVKEDNDVLIQDEQKDPLILEGSCIDGTKVCHVALFSTSDSVIPSLTLSRLRRCRIPLQVLYHRRNQNALKLRWFIK